MASIDTQPTTPTAQPLQADDQPAREIPATPGAAEAPAPVVRPVIAVRNLAKTYSLGQTRVQALRGVTLAITAGEFVAVMGPSGSGKSTFMNLLGCLDRPTSGDYWLAGTAVSHMSADQLADVRNRRIGFVFQGFNLLARSTALENVMLPLMYAGRDQRAQERRARRALELVGLAGRASHRPNQLSGGQQQRVAIARALVNGPRLLLADEPTGNLDSRTSVEIMAVLQTLNAHGLTIVLVTHEPDIAAYASRQIAFRDGRVQSDIPVAPRSAMADLSRIRATAASEGQPLQPPLPSQDASNEPPLQTTQMSTPRQLRATGSLRSSSPSGSVQIKEEP